MTVLLLPLLFGGLLALVVLAAYFSYQRAKRRREAFALAAQQRGWGYAARDDRWVGRFGGAPFGIGHGRTATNVVTGTHDGRPFIAFDYRYRTTEHSTNAQGQQTSREVTHDYSVIALDQGIAYPDLYVTPEGFFSRAVGRLLNKDIELESEEFNRAFTVTCADRKFATDVLHPQMMEFLLGIRDVGFSFREGSAVMVRPGQHSLQEIDARLQWLDDISDRVPAFVVEQFRPPLPPAPGAATH